LTGFLGEWKEKILQNPISWMVWSDNINLQICNMQIFYASGIIGSTWVMDEKESWHSIRVLRLKKGSYIYVVDGKGNLYEGVISIPDPDSCKVEITGVHRDFEKREYKLHIAISLLKNRERFEWFVEKCVEIGVDEITPLICRNTEKKGFKPDRIGKIIISAMKQSLKAFEPSLNKPKTLKEFINSDLSGIKMIAHCNPAFKRTKIDQVYERGSNSIIMIGPEGDFSEEELLSALSKGFKPVHLGNSRLRTETAGIAACHSVYFINQNP
jgi:16S rRNA (uracil1498-N3)-methyltransferase